MSTIPDIFLADLCYSTFPTDGSEPFLNMELNPLTNCQDSNIKLVPVQCEMTNIRGREAEFNLDDAGFKYIKHKSSFNDFQNNEEIKRVYYKESIEVLREHTGARRIVVYDHTIRRDRDEPESSTLRRPALRVHVDQSPQAAINRVRKHVPELAEELLKYRYQIINLWRPIGVPAWDIPLALCDFRSIDKEKDLVPTRLVYADGTAGQVFSVAYNPSHKWVYVRGMTPDEVVLIKKYADSKMGVADTTPHSAFTDPTAPEDVPRRESIELRVLLFYDDLPIEC